MNGEDSGLTTSRSAGSEPWDTIDTNNSLFPKLAKHSSKNFGHSNYNTSQSNKGVKDDSTEDFAEDEDNIKYFNKNDGYLQSSICSSTSLDCSSF